MNKLDGYDLLIDVAEELAARDLEIDFLKKSRADAWRLVWSYKDTVDELSLYQHIRLWFLFKYLRRVTDTERQAYYNLRNFFRK